MASTSFHSKMHYVLGLPLIKKDCDDYRDTSIKPAERAALANGVCNPSSDYKKRSPFPYVEPKVSFQFFS